MTDNRMAVHVFNAHERLCDDKWALYKGIVDFHSIMFVITGSCDFFFDGEKHRLSAGDVAYYAKGTEREAKNHECGTELYTFDFDLFGCDRLPLQKVTHLNNFDGFIPSIKNFFFSWYQKHDGYKITCSGIFMMILSALIYPTSLETKSPHVTTMKKYIAEHLSEEMTVAEIANTVSLSPAYCGTLFKKSEGTTIHEFINIMRINRAKDLLTDNVFSIAEVSASVGYNDVFYFSKKFKLLTGTSPSEYKKLHKR